MAFLQLRCLEFSINSSLTQPEVKPVHSGCSLHRPHLQFLVTYQNAECIFRTMQKGSGFSYFQLPSNYSGLDCWWNQYTWYHFRQMPRRMCSADNGAHTHLCFKCILSGENKDAKLRMGFDRHHQNLCLFETPITLLQTTKIPAAPCALLKRWHFTIINHMIRWRQLSSSGKTKKTGLRLNTINRGMPPWLQKSS